MKKIKLFLLSILIIPFFVACGGNKKANVSTYGSFCTFDTSKTTADINQDFSIRVTPDTGYQLSSKCFNIKVKNNDITSTTNSWSFSNNTISISKNYVVGDIAIVANASKIVTYYNVGVTCNNVKSYGGDFPSSCHSNEDLIVKFNPTSDEYGINATVKINNKDYYNFQLGKETDYSYLKIKNEDIVGNISINLSGVLGKISLSQDRVNIFNYDTITVFYNSPEGGNITVTGDDSKFSFTKKPDNGQIIINSLNNNVCSDVELTVHSDASGSVDSKIKVSVYHPTNVQEALDAVTLAFIRGNTSFDITFDYNNLESFADFTDHLEITETMYNSLSCSNYQTGSGKQYHFYLGNGVKAHGRDYGGYTTVVPTDIYTQLNNANSVITKAECSEKTSTLEIDKSNKTIEVYNSEELFYAVEHGYLPTFGTSNPSKTAKNIYDKARTAVIANSYDGMSTIDECIYLFNYLENLISYDYTCAKSTAGYPEWLKYASYFLEGVFKNNGIAVCDGFSKAYSLLCGLDGLPVIRSFGVSNAGGHAWNYANFDGSWYLICPTWAKENFKVNNLENQFSVFTYDSFAKSCNYFYEMDPDYKFTDEAFPLITKSTSNCNINVLSKTNFVVTSPNDIKDILDKCSLLSLAGTDFYILADCSSIKNKSILNGMIQTAVQLSSFAGTYSKLVCLNDKLSKSLIFFS